MEDKTRSARCIDTYVDDLVVEDFDAISNIKQGPRWSTQRERKRVLLAKTCERDA